MSEKKPEFPVFDASEIVREKVHPLVEQLYDICVQHNIPLVVGVVRYSHEDGNCGIESTQVVRDGWLPDTMADASRCLRGKAIGVPVAVIEAMRAKALLAAITKPEAAALN